MIYVKREFFRYAKKVAAPRVAFGEFVARSEQVHYVQRLRRGLTPVRCAHIIAFGDLSATH
jgi:hypothetical protein